LPYRKIQNLKIYECRYLQSSEQVLVLSRVLVSERLAYLVATISSTVSERQQHSAADGRRGLRAWQNVEQNWPCSWIYVHTFYVIIAHVLLMYYTCIAHVLHMYWTCITHVLHMYHTCIAHVLDMYYTCITHVSHMYCTCIAHVLHMYCTRIIYVLHK
jgi:hypothetical protein